MLVALTLALLLNALYVSAQPKGEVDVTGVTGVTGAVLLSLPQATNPTNAVNSVGMVTWARIKKWMLGRLMGIAAAREGLATKSWECGSSANMAHWTIRTGESFHALT